MNTEELYSEDNQATYCPEDNKLRLYVGRVPKEEYLALRKQGWTSTPKQECDFVGKWTTGREDTCLLYAGIVLDEDQSPEDRAADRAERFSGYREKRRAEAHDHADNYEAGPAVHGHQNAQKAERAAARHDRKADYACDSWSKAEYWQSRTAGVIANALYKDRPGVRQRRIKGIEKDIRSHEKSAKEHTDLIQETWDIHNGLAGNRKLIISRYFHFALQNNDIAGAGKDGAYTIEQAFLGMALTCARDDAEKEKAIAAGELTPEAYGLEWLKDNPERPADVEAGGRWYNHYKLRLAYENQMLEAQGGTGESVEMLPGGTIGRHLIIKVNKSNATGRVNSIGVKTPPITGWVYMSANAPCGTYAIMTIKADNLSESDYTPPTEESLQELKDLKAATKKAAPKAPKLINPTREEAEKLQAIENEQHKGRGEAKEVREMTQTEYSDNAKGSYTSYETMFIISEGKILESRRSEEKPLCKVRTCGYSPRRIVIITDKPQKALPAEVWQEVKEEAPADPEAKLRAAWTADGVSEEKQNELIQGVKDKAAPGASVGPFTIPAKTELFETPFNLATDETQDGSRLQAASDTAKERKEQAAAAQMVLI